MSLENLFERELTRESIFKDRNVVSPHYIPDFLPHREREIQRIMRILAPIVRKKKPSNIFIYGKTGTGKTASVKHVMKKLDGVAQRYNLPIRSFYVNCRIYNTRYKVVLKVLKDIKSWIPDQGLSVTTLYEKLLNWIEPLERHVVVVLDEVDMVKDLSDLLYTLTRINDDLNSGSLSLIGISNRVSFKERLDPRSESALCEEELVFPPYNAEQLRDILRQRVELGFREGVVEESAINLAAAIAAQESGDARYAIELLLKAGDIAEEKGLEKVTFKEVELAREKVEYERVNDLIKTLPEHQRLVLYSIATLTLDGSQKRLLNDGNLTSGEVYDQYTRICRVMGKKERTARWYRQYLNDLEMLGLITLRESGKGQRGHTRYIKLEYAAEKVKKVIEASFRMAI